MKHKLLLALVLLLASILVPATAFAEELEQCPDYNSWKDGNVSVGWKNNRAKNVLIRWESVVVDDSWADRFRAMQLRLFWINLDDYSDFGYKDLRTLYIGTQKKNQYKFMRLDEPGFLRAAVPKTLARKLIKGNYYVNASLADGSPLCAPE